jgi:leader peptidase (prepilin peptidase) / N-methyltransferase
MLAYRLVHDVYLFKKRSFCPKCHNTIYWHDNIPVISWFILKGKCRYCGESISKLYPFIELLSVLLFVPLFYKFTFPFLLSYFIFFSALLITIRSDLETLLISRFATIFLIPLAFVLSYFNWLPITINQSLIGALFGYGLLFLISKIFTLITKKQGIGEGDFELLAFIGSFTGAMGVWISLLIGSIGGSITGIILLLLGKLKFTNKIPFGPFLAFAAIIYILFKDIIIQSLMHNYLF